MTENKKWLSELDKLPEQIKQDAELQRLLLSQRRRLERLGRDYRVRGWPALLKMILRSYPRMM